MSRVIPDIRFYNFDFELLHVENHFISSNWTVYYNEIGNFEAHFDISSDTLSVILDNDYLIAVQGEYYAVITGKSIGSDLTVYGRTCNWLLSKRTIDAFSKETKPIYDLVADKVTEAYSDSQVKIVNSTNANTEISVERTDRCILFDVIKECLAMADTGHKLVPDFEGKTWNLVVFGGNDSNPLVVSVKNRNAYDIVHESDVLDECCSGRYKRTMVNAGEWNADTNWVIVDGENSEKLTNNTPSNYGKYWTVIEAGERFGFNFEQGDYLICRDSAGKLEKSDNCDAFWVTIDKGVAGKGMLYWEKILDASTETEANTELCKSKANNIIQAKTSGIYFCKDYGLGDIVNVEWHLGTVKKRYKKRISGVNAWYERGNIGEEPVFEDV